MNVSATLMEFTTASKVQSIPLSGFKPQPFAGQVFDNVNWECPFHLGAVMNNTFADCFFSICHNPQALTFNLNQSDYWWLWWWLWYFLSEVFNYSANIVIIAKHNNALFCWWAVDSWFSFWFLEWEYKWNKFAFNYVKLEIYRIRIK